MMKSFFKKLAFVMALAMVVSAMAPAATAKAAEAGLLRQESTTWETIKTDELTEGDEQDYKFAYAPTNWKSLGLKWTSSDEAVATVDEVTGLVKAVKAGTTTIKVAGGTYEASLVLTVKAKEVATTFDAKQTTANTVVLTFADADAAKAAVATLAVNKKITTLVGTNYMPWALNDGKTKVEGNTVTIEPWVPFGTASYEISVEGYETFTLDTAVGAPAIVTIDYEKPYIYTDTDAKGAAVTLKVTDAKGVTLTNGFNVYYEIVTSEPAGYAYVDGTTGALSLYADPTYAVVKATVSYTNASGQTVYLDPVTTEVLSSRKPNVTVNNYLEATAVVSTASVDTAANKDKIVWGSTKVKIADGTAQVVGLIKKSDNSSYSINSWSVGTKDATKNELGGGYVFKYTSTDTSKVIVDEATGTLVGVNVTTKPVYVLVTMYKPDSNAANGLSEVGIVAAVPVDVQEAKAARNTTLDKYDATLLTEGTYTTVKVTPTTWNQYDEKVTSDTIKEVSATFNNKTHYIIKDATAADNIKDVTIDANAVNTFFNSGTGAKAVTLTYKITMNSGKTAEFRLTLKEVTAANSANQDFKLDVKGAEVKPDKLNDKVSISVVSKVLGEKYQNVNFFYGKVDPSTAGLKVGDLYVVVLDQNKKVVTPATTSALVPKYEANAVTKNASGAALETLPAGVYTVELYKITALIDGTQGKVALDTRIDVQTYSVTTSALPTVATNINVDLNKKVKSIEYNADGSVKNVILEEGAVTFKFNNEENKGVTTGKFTIVKTEGVTVGSSDKVFVYKMVVRYAVGGNGYIEFTVPVNKTFTK